MEIKPQIGTAVFIFHDKKILLSKRISTHENAKFGVPGGKLDFGEDVEACIRREVREETKLELKDVVALPMVSNNIYKKEGLHFICFWFVAQVDHDDKWDGKVDYVEMDKNGKPKCHGWHWYSHREVQKLPLMRGTLDALEFAKQMTDTGLVFQTTIE